MLSMTGFGAGEAGASGLIVTVELRSVNHRFLDVAMKLPPALVSQEVEVRNFLKKRLARGRISCFVQIRRESGDVAVALDEDRLTRGIELMQQISARLEDATGRPHPVSLTDLLAVPELLRAGESEDEIDLLRTGLFEALEEAVGKLVEMKTVEGDEMVADLRARLVTLRGLLTEVEKRAPQAVTEGLTRIQERLAELLDDNRLEPQRLAQEAAILADKTNINEECERLACHLEHFENALQKGGQVAKQLNFLLQEMHREVNTMGSKTNIMDITQLVISMKDEVESMREQIQNLE